MIAAHQPTCFPPELLVAVSSKSDGTVLDKAVGVHNPSIVTNRTRFCSDCGVSYGDVVYQRIMYGAQQTYDKITEVNESNTCKHVSEVAADALVTTARGVALMLPVADCVATVVYDPVAKRLALLHLGRHSSLTNLITKTVEHFVVNGSQAADLIVWMSPSVHQSSYRLDYFDQAASAEWTLFVQHQGDGFYLDIQGHNQQAFINNGVLTQNIYKSPHNTAASDDYFSHSQGDHAGRFGVLAMLRP